MKIKTWRKFPIALLAYDIPRWEGCGEAVYFVSLEERFVFFTRRFCLGPSHIQYSSPFGFLLAWPLCFHFWFRFKPQQTAVNSNGTVVTVPGSEKVLFISIGFARWDAGADCYMVPRFYMGLHYD